MERQGDRPDRPAALQAYATALGASLFALAAALILEPVAGLENVDLVFLVGVIGVAARLGRGPALVSCVANVLAYNFFFLPPLYTLAVADPRHVIALALFLVAALITSNLAAAVRARSLQALRREATTEQLYAFSSVLSRLTTEQEVAAETAAATGRLLHGQGAVLLRDAAGTLVTTAPSILHRRLEGFELDALATVGSRAGPDGEAKLLRLANDYFVPLATDQGELGALGIGRGLASASSSEATSPGEPISLAADEERMLQAIAGQAAVALSRIRLVTERDAAQMAAERERLRSALLNSLSHDLKTPLAAILGAITALRAFGPSFDDRQRDELTATVEDEARRMERFVVNLLDMARLEAGALEPRREPTDLGDVVGTALRRMAAVTRDHRVSVSLPPSLPLLDLDPVLLEQVLANLIENAAKFAPPGTEIRLAGSRCGDGGVALQIADDGPGIPPADRARVFDLFYQVRHGDSRPAGSGVGLAICRGFVEALGGTIAVVEEPGRTGACFRLVFPLALALPLAEADA